MKPIINLEESPDKVVGRRTAPRDPLSLEGSRKKDMAGWKKAFGFHVPKGVFRFSSHEQADEWMWKHMTHPRTS
jgi:hypothetical protein